MPRKEFESFTRLDASDVNTFLMDQTVQSFADSTARASAITTPVEGMVTYLNDIDSLSVYNGTAFTTDRTIQVFAGTAARGSAIGTAIEGMYTHINETDSLEYYNGTAWESVGGGGGAVLQVKSTFKPDPYTMSSSTFDDVTNLNVSITPTSATNKILVMFSLSGQADEANNGMFVRLMRDSTAIGIADADLTRTRTTYGNISQPPNAGYMGGFTFLDSPATTSAVVYKVQVASNTNGQGVFVNRLNNNADQTNLSRSASSITVMEVTP